jgi:hypothetical protein
MKEMLMSTNIKKYILQEAKFTDSLNYTDGKRYVDSLKWLAKNGKTFKEVDKELSKEVSKHAKLKECYRNCWVVVTDYDENEFDYYQGYAKSSTGVFEHTFLVKDKKVVDPTQGINGKHLTKEYKKIFAKGTEPSGRFDDFPSEYFGVKFGALELKNIMLETEEFRCYIPELYELRK